jgi:inosose dehydratase
VAQGRIAANPIPYWSRNGRVDKSREVLEEAFADFAAIGFTAVKADVPDNLTAAEYLEWIGSYGLEPALSLFNSPFDETIDITEEMERAKRFAATQVALGLDRTMVSSMSLPERMSHPAVGAGLDKDRLALAIENCGIICEVLRVEGLRALHHSHVGGVFETQYEITRLLDELGPGLLGFGAGHRASTLGGHRSCTVDQAVRRPAGGHSHQRTAFPTILIKMPTGSQSATTN